MKKRRFPYGYEMKNGQIVICSKESETVKQIFNQYLAGENLKNIADALTERNTEYSPGKYNWNKSRIKRIIEDSRYLGNDILPAVIDADTYHKANAEKENRRTYTVPTVASGDKSLINLVVCSKCGSKMFHRTDHSQKHSETWYCKSPTCKYGIPMTVTELQDEITKILNRAIDNPTFAEHIEQDVSYNPSLAIQRMEHEIERKLESLDFDKNEIQNLILQCAAKKYEENKSARHITDRLKADFEQSSPLSSYSNDLLERTVSAVIMNRDKSIQLKLKNGEIIGKEEERNDYADRDSAENGQNYSGKTGVFR